MILVSINPLIVYIIFKYQRKPKGQSRMDNLETQATMDTRHRTKNKRHNTENYNDEQ